MIKDVSKSFRLCTWLQRPVDQLAVWAKRFGPMVAGVAHVSEISDTSEVGGMTDLVYCQEALANEFYTMKSPNWATPSADFGLGAAGLCGLAYSDEPENANHNGSLALMSAGAPLNDGKSITGLRAAWTAAGIILFDSRNFNGQTLCTMSGWARSAQHPVTIQDYEIWLPQQQVVSADTYPIAETGSVANLIDSVTVQQRLIEWGSGSKQTRTGFVECPGPGQLWAGANGRLITPDELRFEFWSQIICGCTGIEFFQTTSIPVGAVDTLIGTPLEAEITHCCMTLKALVPFIMNGTWSGFLKFPSVGPNTADISATWTLGTQILTITQDILAPFATNICIN